MFIERAKDRASAVYFLGFVVQCIKWGIDERRATFISFPAEHTQMCILKSVFYKSDRICLHRTKLDMKMTTLASFNKPVQAEEEDFGPRHGS